MRQRPILYILIMVHVSVTIMVKIMKLIIMQYKLSFFLSFQNWIEALTYACVIVCVNSTSYPTQSAYGSIAVLSSFIMFPLYLKKLKLFGVYVVALTRVVKTSVKFLPIFLVLLTGFVLTFTMRIPFGVTFTNGHNMFAYTAIRTFAMVLGDFETIRMGLTQNGEFINHLVYITFLMLMCIIMLNLFVGIAVSDIKVVLDEADISHITLKVKVKT